MTKTDCSRIKKAFLLFVFALICVGCEKMIIGEEADNTPRENFQILWKTLDRNYALFSVKRINWDSLYLVYNAQITDRTNSAELWNIMSALILHLDDGHVNIFNEDFSKSASASRLMRTRNPDDFSIALVKNRYLINPVTAGAGYITYGLVRNKNTGYIHIASFAASNSDYSYQWAYDIDKAIVALQECDALIVDLRNNGGGLIVTENIIASVFVRQPVTYLYSQQKLGPNRNEFGQKVALTVAPRSGSAHFDKKITVLTNRFTGSGGEYVTQLLRCLPNTTQVGDTTFGAFGEVTNIVQLPNGWTFRYPCTLTTLPDGQCPEGRGLIPDVVIENTKAIIESGHDKVMEYVVGF